jgi:L-ascorbate metabolism protein UlaG (beta-lactamase superfamily)
MRAIINGETFDIDIEKGTKAGAIKKVPKLKNGDVFYSEKEKATFFLIRTSYEDDEWMGFVIENQCGESILYADTDLFKDTEDEIISHINRYSFKLVGNIND